MTTTTFQTMNGLQAQPAGPCAIVIFGAAGDLTKRKLLPALYNLAKSNLLPQKFAVIGVARTPNSTDDFRANLTRDIYEFATSSVDTSLWEQLGQRLYYLPGEFQDPDTYTRLKHLLAEVDRECGTQGNYLYYLATAPSFFCDIVWQLGNVGLTQEAEYWRRVVVEKPFGHDLESAQMLNKNITGVLKECQTMSQKKLGAVAK